MSAKVLFVVSSDPRISHRAAEAIRIAAGIGAWETAQVKVYLHGAAVLLLGDFAGRLVDEDGIKRHLGMLSEARPSIYVQAGHPFLAEAGRPGYPHEEISERQLAALALESNYLLHF